MECNLGKDLIDFEVKPVQADPPAKARILSSLICDACGEAAMESRISEH